MMGQDQADKIHRLMEAYYENGVFNGVVLVSQKGNVIYKRAFGTANREWDIPVTPDSKFKIASLSKSFTAMLVLQLVESGRISLDGTIMDYCPNYIGPMGGSITIHQLLSHTSGLPCDNDLAVEAVQERLPHSLREMAGYAEQSALVFPPGNGFNYSNLGYNILAWIVEQVSGKSFDAVLKEAILDPAGMFQSGQFKNDPIEKKLVTGYEYKLLYGFENAVMFDHSYTVGPGGMISTVEDLYRWDRALYSNKLLGRELTLKMFTPYSSGKYGYGWFISKRKIGGEGDSIMMADHAGSINGFGAWMARILRDSTFVVVLKNNRSDTYIDPAFAPVIGGQIVSILHGEQVDLPKKSIARHIASLIGPYNTDSAIAEYHRIRKNGSVDYVMDEPELNKLGIELLFKFKRPDDAAKIFRVNMLQFLRSYNACDSYAYVLMQLGDYGNAVKYYKQGLSVLREYPEDNNPDAVKADAEKALVYIREMEEKIHRIVPGQQVPDTSWQFRFSMVTYRKGKGPVIFIDEAHHNFHTRGGGFFAFSKLLAEDGYRVQGLSAAISSPDALTGCNILVIANPVDQSDAEDWILPNPSAFSDEEIRNINQWVKNGGSLLLIADHMPFACAATQLGKAFGFEFINGFAFTGMQRWPPSMFSRENGMLHGSLVTDAGKDRTRIDSIATFTGSAFTIPEGAIPVLSFRATDWSLQPDTAWRFHDSTPRISLKGCHQGALLEYGRGRVAVFGEAAMFTAQIANGRIPVGFNSPAAPQNAQFTLNLIHWLDETMLMNYTSTD
jgi:CubicO group peptidase (beta-lactamase class C family)